MRALKTIAVAILAGSALPVAIAPFTVKVPTAVPSVEGWERITGSLDLDKPPVSVQYEFYVNPERPATYEVIRYRVTDHDPRHQNDGRYPTTEKLQWDRDGHDLRRYECEPRPEADCAWHEMERGGNDYLREAGVVLWMYGEHYKATQPKR
jgi:hypothetical protein